MDEFPVHIACDRVALRKRWSPRSRRAIVSVLAAGAFVTLGTSLTGCMKPLFPENVPRTQFETYDRMRSRYVPLEEPDVFGIPRPALRARLSPSQ